LIGLVRVHGLDMGLSLLQTCVNVLVMLAQNNLVNCKSLLQLLVHSEISFQDESWQSELYRLACVIVQNPLIREIEYLAYIERLLQEKKPTTINEDNFLKLVVEITNSWRPVSTERVMRHLLRNP